MPEDTLGLPLGYASTLDYGPYGNWGQTIFQPQRRETMPPVAIAAGIAGGSQIIGGLIGSHSAGKAREAQERANAQALAFSKEQAKADQAYRQQLFNAWLNQRNAALQRYGITVPGMDSGLGGGAMAPSPGAVPRGAPPPAAGPPVGVPPGGGAPTLAALSAPPQAGPTLGPWTDWARVGMRR